MYICMLVCVCVSVNAICMVHESIVPATGTYCFRLDRMFRLCNMKMSAEGFKENYTANALTRHDESLASVALSKGQQL